MSRLLTQPEINLIDGVIEAIKKNKTELAIESLEKFKEVKMVDFDKKLNVAEFEWFLNKLNGWSPNSSKKDIKDKEIWVYWSGGCDSTALITSLYRKYQKPVYAYSLYHDCVLNKDKDRHARHVLLEKFKERGIVVNSYEVEIKDGMIGTNAGLAQPNIWLSSLGSIFRQNDRAICFGYVREDDIWHYIAYFKNVFANMAKIMESDSELYFPLEVVSKSDILKYLKQDGLLDFCSYCERDTEEPCGECHSCKRHKLALSEIV